MRASLTKYRKLLVTKDGKEKQSPKALGIKLSGTETTRPVEEGHGAGEDVKMNLFDALLDLRQKAQVVFDYLDRHDTAEDLQSFSDEYAPAEVKDLLSTVLSTSNSVVEALGNVPEVRDTQV